MTNPEAGTYGSVDVASGASTTAIAIGGPPGDVARHPNDVAILGSQVWFSDADDDQLIRIDPATTTEAGTVELSDSPVAIAADDEVIWVATSEGKVLRVDPTAGSDEVADLQSELVGIAVGEGAVWVLQQTGDVAEIDPQSGEVVNTVVTGEDPAAIAAGEGAVWVVHPDDGRLIRITR